VGTVCGSALGLAICRALAGFRIPADVYFLSHLPVQLDGRDVALVAVASLALCVLAALYPAAYAARVPPAEAVREV
jgi:lipoprotein-releasing system permease protein